MFYFCGRQDREEVSTGYWPKRLGRRRSIWKCNHDGLKAQFNTVMDTRVGTAAGQNGKADTFASAGNGFNSIMNFLVMPMLFLSGAMYPVTSMPPALRRLTLINPLTYGVDAFKHVLLRDGTPPLGTEFSLPLDLSIVTAISMVMLTLAALSFRRKE